MGYSKFLEAMIENKLMNLHTAYLAKVISVKGSTAKIQPLGNVKAYGESAKQQAPLSSVPIIQSARNKITVKGETVKATPISAGDVVICLCCERDISNAKKGVNSTPAVNSRHSMSNSVIVGIL